MKTRWIVPAVALILVVGLAGGFAFAATRSQPAPHQPMRDMVAACAAMHESAAMQRMMAQMPVELRAPPASCANTAGESQA